MTRLLAAIILATLSAAMCPPTAHSRDTRNTHRDRHGITVSMTSRPAHRDIWLIFTADSTFEGGTHVMDCLEQRNIKASFFYTGNFLRRPSNLPIVRRSIANGHYVGTHGDGHVLLAAWDRDRTPLASPDSALRDMQHGLALLAPLGIDTAQARTVVPPYEWAAACHTRAMHRAGLTPVCPTPGIETYRDYTTPDLPEYMTAQQLYDQLFDREATHGLDGAFILIHAGTDDARPDKLYNRLGDILDRLTALGYTFNTFHQQP